MTAVPGQDVLVTGAGGGVGGVSRTVVESLLDRDRPVRAMVHHDDGRAERLRALGAQVVVGDLTNPADVARAFTTMAAASIADSGTIRLPFGAGRTSPVAAEDVAGVVTAILEDPGPHLGQVHELTGPRSQDMDGVAEEYARALGRPVSYVDVPLEEWMGDVLPRAGLGPHVEEHIATMARLHREGRYDRSTRTVEEVTGRPAQSVEEFVARHAGLFAR